MSQIYISALVIALMNLAAFLGVDLPTETATEVAAVLVSFALSAWIMFRRKQMGDITATGTRK